MNFIKYFTLFVLLLSPVISCVESPTTAKLPPASEGGVPYQKPQNLVAELNSVRGEHIFAKDNSVLVAGDSLYSINIDDINNPEIVSIIDLPNRATGLTVHNDIAFIPI
ncbi:MAG: hypothetical protein KKD86_14095, partial [Bacteroidetes bacterium]|nr:hypothetical protein [Bacteroidota bacterium]